MKRLCPLCKEYNLKYKGRYIRKCTTCAYEFVKKMESNHLDSLEEGRFFIIEYEISPNGQKVRKAQKYLCQGSFEYCVKVLKLKVFL